MRCLVGGWGPTRRSHHKLTITIPEDNMFDDGKQSRKSRYVVAAPFRRSRSFCSKSDMVPLSYLASGIGNYSSDLKRRYFEAPEREREGSRRVIAAAE
jgi:hypothetical protein